MICSKIFLRTRDINEIPTWAIHYLCRWEYRAATIWASADHVIVLWGRVVHGRLWHHWIWRDCTRTNRLEVARCGRGNPIVSRNAVLTIKSPGNAVVCYIPELIRHYGFTLLLDDLVLSWVEIDALGCLGNCHIFCRRCQVSSARWCLTTSYALLTGLFETLLHLFVGALPLDAPRFVKLSVVSFLFVSGIGDCSWPLLLHLFLLALWFSRCWLIGRLFLTRLAEYELLVSSKAFLKESVVTIELLRLSFFFLIVLICRKIGFIEVLNDASFLKLKVAWTLCLFTLFCSAVLCSIFWRH